MRQAIIPLAILLLLGLTSAWGKVSPEEAAQLGQRLTPMGSEAGPNADGSIPAWTPLPVAPFKRGDHPFADDQPIAEITARNQAQYEHLMTEGQKALFATFPDTFRIKLYPSRRSVAYPQWFLDATRANATKVELTNSGYGFCCAAKGFPFPIPANGTEVMWNHILRYNTKGYRGYLASAATTPAGDYVVVRDYLELSFVYNNPATTLDTLKGQNLFAMNKTVAPLSKAGASYLLHLPLDRVAESVNLWAYNTSHNRTLRVSEVGHDHPVFDGLMTQDQIDMFNGPLDRYTIKLLGKRELITPYNAYALYSDRIKYKDIIAKGHTNPALSRYEKHRVWVIEAEVRPGISHRYKKRVFYLDEDSWLVLAQDIYDERGQFWRYSEAHPIAFPQVPVMINGVQVHYDLQSRRYVVLNLTNEEKDLIEYDWEQEPGYFTPSNLKRFASQRR